MLQENTMADVTAFNRKPGTNAAERQLRIDLAAAFRLSAFYDWHEAVANHFSLAVSPDGKQFLMNPRWMHFARIKASDLLLLNADDRSTMDKPDAPDLTAWSIHGRLHALLPHARCIIHLHPPMPPPWLHWPIPKSSRSTRTRPGSSIAWPSISTTAAWPTPMPRANAWPSSGQPFHHDDGQPWRADLRLDRRGGL
jgi:hypothetical protein